MSEKKDMTGQPYGRWLVLEDAGQDKHGYDLWRCRCSCPLGTERVVLGQNLRQGKSQSCGCLRREKTIEHNTTHGLRKSNPRLYHSVHNHFRDIRNGVRGGYQRWTLDPRYSDDAEGVAKFCNDLIALHPDGCAHYETDRTLDLDKDNDIGTTFRPESIVFRPASENRGKQYDNLKLDDGRSLSGFCRQVGIETVKEHGRLTTQYQRIQQWFRRGKIHPELVKAANQTILVMRQCVELLKLLDDVKALKRSISNI